MGGGVCFSFCVISICILGQQIAANADPIPASYDWCTYLVRHHSHKHVAAPTTTAAPDDKPKETEDSTDKVDFFRNFLRGLLDLEKEAETKKKEEEKKKKEEEEKKKKEEEAKKESKKVEPKGFQNMNDFWDSYIKFLTALYYSI